MLCELQYHLLGAELVEIYDIVNQNNDKLQVYQNRTGFKTCLSQAIPSERAIIHNDYEPEVLALFTSLVYKDSIVFNIGGGLRFIHFYGQPKPNKLYCAGSNPHNIARIKDIISR